MSAAPDDTTLAAIAATRKQLWAGGYRPVPVLSHTDPDPVKAGKAPLHKDWPDRARRTPPEAATTPAQRHLANTGILCDGLRVIDVDVDDRERAEAIEALMTAMLGVPPIRRRSNSFRFCAVYRAAVGEPPKRTLKGTTGDDPKHLDKIEILGKGQHFVAYGTHVTGVEIYWAVGPLDLHRDQLRAVTEEQIAAFLAAATPIIEAKAPAGRHRANGAGNGAAVTSLAPLAAALDLIPAEVADDYNEWIRAGAALYHATGGTDDGMALWAAWAAKSSKFTDDETAAKWNSFGESSVDAKAGAGTIFHMATPYGWHPPDPLDDPAYVAALEAEAEAARRRGSGQQRPIQSSEEAKRPWRNTERRLAPEGGPPPEARPDDQGLQPQGSPSGRLITELAAVGVFIASFHSDLRFNHSNGSWLVWAEHFWKPDQRKLAFSWALKLCKQLAQGITIKGRLVVEKVRFSAAVEQGARAMPPISTAQEDWDNDPWLLGTPGGVVDLKTGTLRPGDRSDMITKTAAITPANAPDCPLWLKFLDEAMDADEALIGFIQRFCGYCLTGVTVEEIILFMFGVGGSGKGTLVGTLSAIMGKYAGTSPMEVFAGTTWAPKEYYRADMAGKRLIVANEPEQGTFWAEAFVKEISGGDELSGRHPAGRPFDFQPTHKTLLHGNHMPRLRGRSTAMERRLRILPFNHKPAFPDPNLKTKLRAEWPGILRWIIIGCLEWQRIGLQPPDAVLAANTSYFEAQDVFARWIEERCILDPMLQLAPAKLRASFNAWAKENGESDMDGNAFSEAVDHFDGAKLIRGRTSGKRWIRGIGLKPPRSTRRYGDDGSEANEPEDVG